MELRVSTVGDYDGGVFHTITVLGYNAESKEYDREVCVINLNDGPDLEAGRGASSAVKVTPHGGETVVVKYKE